MGGMSKCTTAKLEADFAKDIHGTLMVEWFP